MQIRIIRERKNSTLITFFILEVIYWKTNLPWVSFQESNIEVGSTRLAGGRVSFLTSCQNKKWKIVGKWNSGIKLSKSTSSHLPSLARLDLLMDSQPYQATLPPWTKVLKACEQMRNYFTFKPQKIRLLHILRCQYYSAWYFNGDQIHWSTQGVCIINRES